MRATLNSLDNLDNDMREQNQRLMKTMEAKTMEDQATAAQLEQISSRSDLSQTA